MAERITIKFTESDMKEAFMDYANKTLGLELSLKDLVGFGLIRGVKHKDYTGYYGVITYRSE